LSYQETSLKKRFSPGLVFFMRPSIASIEVSLAERSTSPTAFAAPVVDGMMLIAAARSPRQSFFEGPSTTFCLAV